MSTISMIQIAVPLFRIHSICMLLLFALLGCNPGNASQPELSVFWYGGLSANEITFSIQATAEGKAALLLYEPGKRSATTLKRNLTFGGTEAPPLKPVFDNLLPGTKYCYELQWEGADGSAVEGCFHTPGEGPYSFQFAFGSCAQTGSEHEVFRTIAALNPLFFLSTGDLHYENISATCDAAYAEAYRRVSGSNAQRSLHTAVPFAYVWDDHDFGPNNSDASAPCHREAIETYRQFIPHYPLGFNSEYSPISQAFTIGRVRFVLTDLRSQKTKPQYGEGCERTAEGSVFGTQEHKQWFYDQLLDARNSGEVVLWVSGIPWINHEGGPNYHCKENDDWGGYPEERQAIANFVKQHRIPVAILSGDAHMLAIDDGTHADYATGGGAPIPLFSAAALDRKGSYKGGPYSHGYKPGGGQFGWVQVHDLGTKVCMEWTGMNHLGQVVLNTQGNPISYQFCMDM